MTKLFHGGIGSSFTLATVETAKAADLQKAAYVKPTSPHGGNKSTNLSGRRSQTAKQHCTQG